MTNGYGATSIAAAAPRAAVAPGHGVRHVGTKRGLPEVVVAAGITAGINEPDDEGSSEGLVIGLCSPPSAWGEAGLAPLRASPASRAARPAASVPVLMTLAPRAPPRQAAHGRVPPDLPAPPHLHRDVRARLAGCSCWPGSWSASPRSTAGSGSASPAARATSTASSRRPVNLAGGAGAAIRVGTQAVCHEPKPLTRSPPFCPTPVRQLEPEPSILA